MKSEFINQALMAELGKNRNAEPKPKQRRDHGILI